MWVHRVWLECCPKTVICKNEGCHTLMFVECLAGGEGGSSLGQLAGCQ